MLVAIFMRYVIFYPFPWAEEAARYLMIWGMLIGISIGVREKTHLGVEMLVNILPAKWKKVFFIISDLIILFAFIWFAALSMQLVSNIKSSGQTAPAMRIPMYLSYVSLPVGLILSTIRQIQNIWRNHIRKTNVNMQQEGGN